ncbi:serine/threonine protein kinase [Lujinxingia sediminis]|uniref:Serine/threonine protein kinase n=1 Tax=Lujinxingia sediminis TaxID=2480984 RepID=A0ABY0CQ73_9DELT|nr:serine/threonine-protein kinase [Lujinxingia sediminis]RVU42639.1 serine/threonine protein kinase [Lujinxingia sediminis]
MDWNPPQPGDIFEGKYRIESVLGVGGFAHVYRATQLDLGRPVALKVLKPFSPPRSGDADAAEDVWIKRFRREAQLVAQLRDPHTITMYEYGQADNGMSYMAFEFVSGKSLDVVLKESGPLSAKRVAAILTQALESLAEAHQYGVLHRDIKPANILVYEHLGKTDRVKVLDFGIAKPLADETDLTSSDLTQAGMIVGTPSYMAPEQLTGEGIGPASDIYSMGLVAFELLTGSKAAAGPTTMTIISKQLSPEVFKVPAELDVPAGLRSIINCMLAKNLETRFKTAGDVAALLENWDSETPLVGEQTPAPMPAPAAITADLRSPPPEAHITPPPPELPAAPPHAGELSGERDAPRKSGIAAPVIAIILVLLLIGAGLFWMMRQQSPTPTPDPHVELAASPTPVPRPSPTSEPVEAPEELAPTAEHEAIAPLIVETEPSGLELFINDEPVGTSPLTLPSDDLQYPLTLIARHNDGRETSLLVDAPSETVSLTLPDPAPAPEPEAKHRPRRIERPRSTSPRRTEPETTRTQQAPESEPRTAPETQTESERRPTTDAKKKAEPEPSFPALDTLF